MLLCILFSKFDVKIGPCLSVQSPANSLSKKQFGLIDNLLITKPELCGRTLTIRSLGEPIISCPVKIDGKQYPRNYLLFNVAFVLSADTETLPYEPVVRKLAGYLRLLEIESDFIVNGKAEEVLESVFDQVRHSLNNNSWCAVPVQDGEFIRLQLNTVDEIVSKLKLSEVPLLLIPAEELLKGEIDWTLREILPFMNGTNFVRKIAILSQVDSALVVKAIECLVARGYAVMVPTFQYCSTYVVAAGITELLTDGDLQRRAIKSTQLQDYDDDQQKPSIELLFSLYSDLVPREPYLTVAEFNERHNLSKHGIDLRRFIYFGVIEGILRKIDRYPILLQRETNLRNLLPMKLLQGNHSIDDICCETELSYRELTEILEHDLNCDYFYK